MRLHGLDLLESLDNGWIRKRCPKPSPGRCQVSGSTDPRGSKLQIMHGGGYHSRTGAVHPLYAISGGTDDMTDIRPTYINIYPIEALDTLRCMQLRTAGLRIDVCDDRARSKASMSPMLLPFLAPLGSLCHTCFLSYQDRKDGKRMTL